ncbi:MAG: hypothetical protein E7294_09130 [Lachnospiraceae bacterium]|jgi:hypothetical protein|nr:hypothetical protein [Lachnospiraceae bacterium]
MANESEKQNQSPKKGGKVAIVVGIVVIIALLGVIVFLLLKEQKLEDQVAEKQETPKRDVVVTQDNVDEVVDDMVNQEYVEPGYYSVSMSTEWHFETGEVASNDAFVENVPENTNDVYFDVFLKEDESTPILQSPVIPRGGKMESIKLDTPLEKGTHDCVMVYHLIDENQNTVSTLRFGFKIVIEN